MLEAVFEFAQGYTSISTLAFRAICGIQLLPIVRFNDPARFLCTDSVQWEVWWVKQLCCMGRWCSTSSVLKSSVYSFKCLLDHLVHFLTGKFVFLIVNTVITATGSPNFDMLSPYYLFPMKLLLEIPLFYVKILYNNWNFFRQD